MGEIMMMFEKFLQQYRLGHLDPQQRTAASTTDGPVLLLAVPGSGKTTTLIARLGYLVLGCGVRPEDILTMTYTVAATQEMRQRFIDRFGKDVGDRMEFRTINSVCYKIVALYGQKGNWIPRMATEGESDAVVRDIYKALAQSYPTDADIKTMRMVISNIKNRMMDKVQTEAAGFDLPFSAWTLYNDYQAAMGGRQLMDFDDQLVMAYQILISDPQILNAYQEKYKHICVDEAQDTSKIQHEIIALLAQKNRNLFMVGDEDQSIYGFRAACPQELMEFEKKWPGAKILLIETNYRSTDEIVDASAKFIRQNKARRDKKMHGVNGHGEAIRAIPVANRLEQYRLLAGMGQTAMETNSPLTVLYRNNDSALPVIDALEKRGIPYQAKGNDGLFFKGRVYLGVMDFVRLALNPRDKDAFMSLYYKLGLFVRRQQAQAAVSRYSKKPLLDVLGEVTGNDKCYDLSRIFTSLLTMKAVDALKTIRYQLKFADYLKSCKVGTARLDTLEFLAQEDASLTDFVTHMERLQKIIRDGRQEPASFVLSTIHSAKGLEYDHVILADVYDGEFPVDPYQTETPLVGETDLEEERRLFYVGMTRARKTLGIIRVAGQTSDFADFVFETGNQGKKKSQPKASAAPSKTVAREKAQKWQKEKGRQGRDNDWSKWDDALWDEGHNNAPQWPVRPSAAQSSAKRISSFSGSSVHQVTSHFDETVEFRVGDKVKHAVFGEGTVVERMKTGILRIQFAKEEKKISPEYSVNAGLMKKISGS